MSSEKAQATRRTSSLQWTQTHMKVAAPPAPSQTSQQQSELKPQGAAVSPQVQGGVAVPPVVASVSPTPAPSVSSRIPGWQEPTRKQSTAKTVDQRLDDAEKDFNNVLLPQCNKFLTMPSTQKARNPEYQRLTKHIERGLINWLGGLPIPEDHPAQNRRKAMIVHAQQVLGILDRAPESAPPGTAPTEVPIPAAELTGSALKPAVVATSPSTETAHPQAQPAPIASPAPPPYSPVSRAPTSGNTAPPTSILSEKPPPKPVVRRRAPPPPKRVINAKALYDFEPELDNEEELAIRENDEIEIVEKTAVLEEEGWCRAKIKGARKIGLVPLEYLEIEQKASTAMQAPAPISVAVTQLNTITQPSVNASVGQGDQAPTSGAPPFSAYPLAVFGTNTLPMHSQYQEPPIDTKKLGKRLEITGLKNATLGAAAGVTTVFQGQNQSRSDDDAQPANVTTGYLQSSSGWDQLLSPAPYRGNERDETRNTNSIVGNTPLSAPDDTSPPPLSPVTDLSAFSCPPFEPQPLASGY